MDAHRVCQDLSANEARFFLESADEGFDERKTTLPPIISIITCLGSGILNYFFVGESKESKILSVQRSPSISAPRSSHQSIRSLDVRSIKTAKVIRVFWGGCPGRFIWKKRWYKNVLRQQTWVFFPKETDVGMILLMEEILHHWDKFKPYV